MDFRLYPLRLTFRATERLVFPPGKAANVLRGALGMSLRDLACDPGCSNAKTCSRAAACRYAQLFEPSAHLPGPSGLRDWPRPFVIRAAHLDGDRLVTGDQFHLDVHLFRDDADSARILVKAFARLAANGFGPGEGKALLQSVRLLHTASDWEPFVIDLRPTPHTGRIRVDFQTPTELKPLAPGRDPDFATLFARIRDRVSTLRACYGAGALNIEFKAMGEIADGIKLIQCEIGNQEVVRRSSRTGQSHSIGGFTGHAEYEGDLGPFLPFLEAARWTGVGSKCVWGNGQISVRRLG